MMDKGFPIELEGLLGVELCLPAQFWGATGASGIGAPEQRLMIAVLHEALRSLALNATRTRPTAKRLVQEIDLWLAAESRTYLFGFGAVCDVLGLDAPSVRRLILDWRHALATRTVHRRRTYSGRGRHRVQSRPNAGRRRGHASGLDRSFQTI